MEGNTSQEPCPFTEKATKKPSLEHGPARILKLSDLVSRGIHVSDFLENNLCHYGTESEDTFLHRILFISSSQPIGYFIIIL